VPLPPGCSGTSWRGATGLAQLSERQPAGGRKGTGKRQGRRHALGPTLLAGRVGVGICSSVISSVTDQPVMAGLGALAALMPTCTRM
jgi:hypothetical protein